MIRLDNIEKTYTRGSIAIRVLVDISLHIEQGDFISIMGPSGCGKSTLLNLLGLLDKPSAGTYQYNNEDLLAMDRKTLALFRQKHIGFVFQNFNLIDQLTVRENVMLPLMYFPMPKQEKKDRVDYLLQQVGLYSHADFFPSQLSGGQQQRVAIGRAIASRPPVILADEPTGNLDSKNSNQVMEILSQLNDTGTTVVMVTHSEYEARYAKRVWYMQDGQILMEKKNIVSGALI
ncbi:MULTISPECIES: ABC transporter ATP-binding protein [Chitinophagaceae]